MCQVCEDLQSTAIGPRWRRLHHSQCSTLLVSVLAYGIFAINKAVAVTNTKNSHNFEFSTVTEYRVPKTFCFANFRGRELVLRVSKRVFLDFIFL